MRIALALTAAIVLTAAAPQQPARDWRLTNSVTPAGSVLTGNPAARVKLVEYFSFTCSHCADFAREAKPVLHDSLVRRGLVQVEARAAVRDGFDLAAWAVARCAPVSRFTAVTGDIFAQQLVWMEKGGRWVQANGAKVKTQPLARQVRAFADGAGLTAIGAKHGLTSKAFTACLAGDKLTGQLDAMTRAAFARIPGTPGFEINGKLADGVASWAALQPALAAAGAR